MGEASHPGPTGGEFGRFSSISVEDEVEVVPRTRRLVSVSQHAAQLVLRRLRLPLLLSVRSCRCGRTIDIFGHARAGVLGRRGFALESAVARICREAGGPVHGPRGACHGQQTSGSCG